MEDINSVKSEGKELCNKIIDIAKKINDNIDKINDNIDKINDNIDKINDNNSKNIVKNKFLIKTAGRNGTKWDNTIINWKNSLRR